MDPRRGRISGATLGVRSMLGLLLFFSFNFASANFVFNVQHKFAAHERTLEALKAHDDRRHGRRLAAVDMPLGGDGSATGTALYYTKIGLGTPSKDYYVQVDTGSDLMWVNCGGCQGCPTKTNLGFKLQLYEQNESSSATKVRCEEDFCSVVIEEPTCKVGALCAYALTYGDGSEIRGHLVEDTIQLDQASGNLQTTPMNGSIAFGCSTKLSGGLDSSSQAVDGLMGFGQSNSSVISQLALAGKVRHSFLHCLAGPKGGGGGIFAIGQLVEPKLKTTPLLPNKRHYNVLMTSLEVGSTVLPLPKDTSGGDSGIPVVIDSGTTLAVLDDDLYNPLVKKILDAQPGLTIKAVQNLYKCFDFPGKVDDGFPDVIMRFNGSLSLTVRPHEYLFRYEDLWCIGWQNSGMKISDGQYMNILGDMVLNNRLVMYDLENRTIGWTEYDCSSSIKVRDIQSGAEYQIGSHDISSSASLDKGWVLLTLLLLPLILRRYQM